MFSAFLAGFVFAPSAAHAECGDYVMMGGKAAHDGGAKASHGAAATTTEFGRAAPIPQDKHAPCSGPKCSRRAPAEPVPAPPAPVRNGTENWGYATAGQDLSDADSGRLVYEFKTAHPLHRVSAIYHPPR